jgi:hypothetical protein
MKSDVAGEGKSSPKLKILLQQQGLQQGTQKVFLKQKKPRLYSQGFSINYQLKIMQ